MGVKFRKSKKIMPGVRLNVSKKGVGVRVGGKHGGMSFSPTGTRVSASVPGTGVSYTTKVGGAKSKNAASASKINKAKSAVPAPLRGWYIVVAIALFIAGIGSFSKSVGAAIFALVICAAMIFGTVLTIRKMKSINDKTDIAE